MRAAEELERIGEKEVVWLVTESQVAIIYACIGEGCCSWYLRVWKVEGAKGKCGERGVGVGVGELRLAA